MKTTYQVAEFIQSAFSFDDDDRVVSVNLNTRWQEIFGDDYPRVEGFQDFDDIRSDMNGFYRAIRARATRIYGNLPF